MEEPQCHSAASRDRRPWSNGAKEAIPLTASALTEGHRSSSRPRRYIMCLVSPRRPLSGTAQITNGYGWWKIMVYIYHNISTVCIYISYISWYTMVYPGIDPSEWPMAVSIFTEASLSNSACRCGMMQPSRSKSDTLMKNDEHCNLCLPRSQEPSNRAKAWVVLMVTRCHQHTRSKNPKHGTSSNVLGRRASAESWTAPLPCQTHQCLLNEHP
jgi:hypothetical protein